MSSTPFLLAKALTCLAAGSRNIVFSVGLVSAVVIGDQYIDPTCAALLPVRITDAPVGSHLMFLPDNIRVPRLALEGTLSAQISNVVVINVAGSSITYDVFFICSFASNNCLSVENPSHLLAAVFSQTTVWED